MAEYRAGRALLHSRCISQLIAGRFRIVRFIARGGMGEVYEAEDLALSTRLALKTIRRSLAGDPGLAMFKEEIQSARKALHLRFVRRIRGSIPARATCQVSDRAQVRG